MNSIEHARQYWYPVAMINELQPGQQRDTQLLDSRLTLTGDEQYGIVATANEKTLLATQACGHWWVTLCDKPLPMFDLPEAQEHERRFVPCGVVHVECSPLRAVENFLDIAHFPFVHTDVLGAEPHTEVYRYDVKVDESRDEVIASNIRFYQPQAAKSAEGGIHTEYTYRVPAPMVAVLYKTCPQKPEAMDVIALFVQPLSEESCDVWPWMALYDNESTQSELVEFQQMIFVQDRSILENQMPRRLPIDPGLEIPTKADLTSVAYRRWLKQRGAYYGALAS
jgi:phenylpropionate dioxygenase-like ring-hydroxylating dioxygenase large terminal subunit